MYGRIMDDSEQQRPYLGPGAKPLKLTVALNAEHGGVVEVTAYNSFRSSNRRGGKGLGARRMRVDLGEMTVSKKRWGRWKTLKGGGSPRSLGRFEKPDPGLPPGVRLLSDVEAEERAATQD